MCRRLAIACLLFLPATPSLGDDLFDRPERAPAIGEIRPFERLYKYQPAEEPAPAQPEQDLKPFGSKGTHHATFGGGYANNFGDAHDINLRIAWSYFVVRDLEFSTELNAWYHDQPGDNATGINPAFVFRWHWFNEGRWSVFTDLGIGLLFTTDDVPEGGTSFNFTPRVGGGFTYRLDDAGTRLQVGLRWHHISNARIRGDSDNPARDGLMLYAGIMIPF